MTLAKFARALALCLLAVSTPSALAQLRTIPANAQSGTIRHLQGMLVEIDGKPVMLAPGSRSRSIFVAVSIPLSVRLHCVR